uniref:DUF659 domain-containing protein n=1 Tax=Strongyloides stercoralis TaxID=6248 RepID=A0A0K0EC69_STRER
MDASNYQQPTAPEKPESFAYDGFEKDGEDDIMEAFLAAYEISKKRWTKQQRNLKENPLANNEDKEQLEDKQAKELEKMLTAFNISDKHSFLLPYEWETESNHPRLEKLTTLIVSQLSKHGKLKLFIKGGDVEFGIWKEETINFLKVVTVDDEGFDITNQLCVSLITKFIPHHNEAKHFLNMALRTKMDEDGKLPPGVLFTTILGEIWQSMRKSQKTKRNQVLAQALQCCYGKDTIETFTKKYDEYLCKRLGVQVVNLYLDSVPALRREYFLNYQEGIPMKIRREVKFDITKDVTWDEFINLFIEAEALLKTWDSTEKKSNQERTNKNGAPPYNNEKKIF